MNKDEVVVRIVNKLDLTYGDKVNQQEVKGIIEEVLYGYTITTTETSLVVVNDMDDKLMLYIATKKLDGLSDITLKTYNRNLRRFSMAIRKDVVDITTMDIRMYLANYLKTGIKNSTLRTEIDILRGFFNWLKMEECIEKNPMDKIKPIKIEQRMRKGLSKEEVEILRSGCKTFRERGLLETFLSTGARLDELANIKKSDIDWQKLQLRVIGKGNKERVVYINAKAKIHLQKYLSSRTDDCNALFVTERKPITKLGRRSIQREIAKVGMSSGLKREVYPHLLRHTMSTQLLNNGANITTLKSILGHSSLDTTEIYAQMSDANIEHDFRKHI